MEETTQSVATTDTKKGAFCFDKPSNTMAALAMLCAIAALIIMYKFTEKRGFWWGLGFWFLGAATGTAVGRLIEPPTEECI